MNAAARPRLIACADDFGLHEGTNEAVLALAAQGRLTATSALVTGPAWRTGASALRQLDPGRIDVGLHLDFTQATIHPALARPLPALIAAALLRRLDPGLVRAEIEAQFDAFEDQMQRPPAYVDGHQHVHQLPLIRVALLEAIARRRPTWRPWLRSTQPAPVGTWPDRFKARVIDALGGGRLRHAAGARGLATSAHLLGVYGFDGDIERHRARMRAWVDVASDRDVLMCHPATRLNDGDAIGRARVAEFELLGSPWWQDLLATRRILLCRGTDCLG